MIVVKGVVASCRVKRAIIKRYENVIMVLVCPLSKRCGEDVTDVSWIKTALEIRSELH